ncbi:hypothetical protein RRG08_056256 [Elysia crispata]|uniref:Uncharacterized protein n=1 Tax=Elysia crispata TaxID=231223 RepID=A0AAE1E704_9GAST|nr:hypothetical protein RRG08_056256 [Elysia crispata]
MEFTINRKGCVNDMPGGQRGRRNSETIETHSQINKDRGSAVDKRTSTTKLIISPNLGARSNLLEELFYPVCTSINRLGVPVLLRCYRKERPRWLKLRKR